jgi:hypothetical protein
MNNPLAWVFVLGGVCVFLVLVLTAAGKVQENPEPVAFEYITPAAQIIGIPAGCLAALAVLVVVAVIATKGILWG